MGFNIFIPFVYIASNLNVSFDIVQSERFTRERRQYWKLTRAKKIRESRSRIQPENKVNRTLTVNSPQLIIKNILLRLRDDLGWILEYNQVGYLHLVLVMSHIIILFEQMVVSMIYSVLPWNRDPMTNEYQHPTLNYLESWLLVNFFEKLNRGRTLNRLLSLICIQFLLLRLRSVYIRYRNAKINQASYKEINIVQLNMAYAGELSADLKGWLSFLFGTERHICENETILKTGQGRLMKDLSSRLKKFHKIDRLYYFNQIDFGACYAHHRIFERSSANLGDSSPIIDRQRRSGAQLQSIDNGEGATNKPTRRRSLCDRLKAHLVIEVAGRRAYLPKPKHRVDPSHLRELAIIYLATSLAVLGVLCTTFASVIKIEIDYVQPNADQQSTSIWHSWWNFMRLLASIWAGSLTICVLAINAYDNSLMAYSSLICHSRSDKVIKMLNGENKYHRELLRGFCDYLDHLGVSHVDLDFPNDDDDDGDDRLDLIDLERLMSDEQSLNDQPVIHKSDISAQNNHKDINSYVLELESEIYKFSLPKRSVSINKHESNKMKRSMFESLATSYRAQLNIESRLSEFNGNINYLIDLIGVLKNELYDMKAYFTTFINMNILFGILTSSIAIDLLLSSNTTPDLVIHINTSIITVAPLIYALFIGATSERSFRHIYNALVPLMINQLGLVEPEVVQRLQKLCHHLAVKDNRSFVVLGTYPLTFGSMTSILAWIATGNLLLQRFFV